MDTGDAAGDVMFGLNQMLLPQLCPMEPDFTWCANRQYLSGGGAHMVYTQFTVESDARFGEYNACNPNADTGIFECETYSSNAQVCADRYPQPLPLCYHCRYSRTAACSATIRALPSFCLFHPEYATADDNLLHQVNSESIVVLTLVENGN